MKNNKGFRILIIIGLFLVGFVAGFVITTNLPKKAVSSPTPIPPAIVIDEIPNPNIQVGEGGEAVKTITPVSENSIGILFLGMGGAGHEGGGLTDSITLANINYATKVINLIAIPRDLWYSGQKINNAYLLDKGKTVKFNVGQITGLSTDYFIAVDFNNFISGINSLGGVDVDNPVTWNDYFYPIKGREQELCGFIPEYNAEINQKYKGFELEKLFTCRYEQLHFDQGPVHLSGETALKYIRSRHSSEYGSDFARGQRAQAVLIAIGKKLIQNKLIDPGNSSFKKLAGLVSSDITLTKVPEILQTIGEISSYKIIHTYLTDQNVLTSATGPNGAFILIPKAGTTNFDEVRNFIRTESQ